MHRTFAAALCSLAALGPAAAQTVEFRIVERQGQNVVVLPPGSTPQTDSVLAFAVQARVVGGTPGITGLASFQFDIALAGEPDAAGVLAKLATSNPDGTYAPNATQTVSTTVGRGGLAGVYTYLAGINPTFNGMINTSSGTFTNGPDQEIGSLNGSAAGTVLQLVLDPADSGAPLWPNPPVGRTYFAVDASWIDLYRFKYTLSDITTPRSFAVTLRNPQAQVFDTITLRNGVWTPDARPATAAVVSTSISIAALAACCQASGACAVTASGACTTGVFLPASSCAPTTCDALGRCCARASNSFCLITSSLACEAGAWIAGGSCTPDPCTLPGTGVCCDRTTGACVLSAPTTCTQLWIGGVTCDPTPCAFTGACCLDQSATCTLVTQSACAGQWHAGMPCTPAVCPFGACCRGSACSVTSPAICVSFVGQYRGDETACLSITDPNRCCTANFNGENSVTVQDIFDFLHAFFVADPRANINADGVVNVQDIMDFVSVWFAGC